MFLYLFIYFYSHQPKKFSQQFREFLRLCFVFDKGKRATAKQLLKVFKIIIYCLHYYFVIRSFLFLFLYLIHVYSFFLASFVEERSKKNKNVKI